jgi:hypothetical protein
VSQMAQPKTSRYGGQIVEGHFYTIIIPQESHTLQ